MVHAPAGAGGNGCASVHREKFKPLGGPDGGNGGRGGSVVLVVDPGVHTLLDFHHRPHATARNGTQGQGGFKAGANADDLELRVPDGTVVFDERGEIVADLVGAGTPFVAAEGGRGGVGPAAPAPPTPPGPAGAWATPRGPGRPAGRPGPPCWASGGRAVSWSSSCDGGPTSGWSASRPPGSPRWSPRCPRPAPRSLTTRSPRWCPSWAW